MADPNEAPAESKRALRSAMRRMRRELPDRSARSERIVEHLTAIEAVQRARNFMVYDAVVGEVDLGGLLTWALRRGKVVAMPEDGVAPDWPDVIVVPGVAFTARGERLGQGGGWYDRFLPGRRDEAVMIGVGFVPQIVDVLPIEPHDVLLDCVVTEDGPVWRDG